MQTKIISAFPGVGKTTFYNKNKDICLDSDSSLFSWSEDENGSKIRNPDFPRNYIEHIKENIGKYEWILVSSHKEVRDALLYNCLFFYLVYPSINRKDEFIQRFKERGSSEEFINLLKLNWETWIDELSMSEEGLKNLELRFSGTNLEDKLKNF